VRQEFEAMSEKLWELAKKKEKENEAAEEEKDKPIAPAGLYAHRQRPYQESMSATRSIIILAIVSILEMAYIVFNIWIKNR